MEIDISSIVTPNFSSQFLVTVIFSLLSLFLAFFSLRSVILFRFFNKSDSLTLSTAPATSANKMCNCSCTCTDGRSNCTPDCAAAVTGYMNGGSEAVVVAERQTGASMMEQLVPEITTHALSYLDYPSLCRLSMTNSLMRKAANDDNAWKALYHKDFTMEQDSVTPVNGWKAYYAATRAVVNVNAEFFNIIRERSLPRMGHFWLNADYVKCVHTSGEPFSGYNAVIQSWQFAFNWEQGANFQVRDVRVRVLTDVAWVTMKTYVNMDAGPFNVTNVYEFHSGRWYMVHHHSSLMLIDGEMEQQHG